MYEATSNVNMSNYDAPEIEPGRLDFHKKSSSKKFVQLKRANSAERHVHPTHKFGKPTFTPALPTKPSCKT